MLFLIGQISFFLLIAVLEGLLIGWLIARHLYLQKMVDAKMEWDSTLKDKKLEMTILQNVLNKKILEITTLQQQLHECQKRHFQQRDTFERESGTNKNMQLVSRTLNREKRDNLKEISGIGRFLERRLNELGIVSISQIASWKHTDIERIAKAIGPFPSRINRDNWVGKAKEILSHKALNLQQRRVEGLHNS